MKTASKPQSHWAAMAPGFGCSYRKNCAERLKALKKSGFSFYGLNSPTLKVASSNLVSRTNENHPFFKKRVVFVTFQADLFLRKMSLAHNWRTTSKKQRLPGSVTAIFMPCGE
ncbi:MAG: hypothetical protein ACI4O0_09220 [Candidatus Limivicinus sp.]